MNTRHGLAAVLALALAGPGTAQEPPTAAGTGATDPAATDAPAVVDWEKEVARACTSPRYGLRLAASKKVAAGGTAAMLAVRTFTQWNGSNALPVALVEAIADGGDKGEAVVLLTEWANDREFYWRALAIKGLAVRCKDGAPQSAFPFRKHLDDPAWLVRAHAKIGSYWCSLSSGSPKPELLDDADPRARTKMVATVATVGGEPLVEALGDHRTFLGDPWGRRRAAEAFQALKRIHGKDWGYQPGSYEANREAFVAIAHDLACAMPAHLVDADLPFVGGLEILSCRNGDLFLRWTDDGRVSGGVTPEDHPPVRIDAARWQQLSAAAAQLTLPAQSGVVICDKMRILPGKDRAQAAIAPAAMPTEAADWLKQLAAAIEEAGEPSLAGALRDRLAQFVR